MDSTSYKTETRRLESFHGDDKKKIFSMLREAFSENFTSLLDDFQLERYLLEVNYGVNIANITIVKNKDNLVGLAIVGQQVSLIRCLLHYEHPLGFLKFIIRCLASFKILNSSLINVLSRKNNETPLSEENSLYLSYICIDNEQHRKGLGSLLMETLISNLKLSNTDVLYCHMDSTSPQVRGFYQSHGWNIESYAVRSAAWLDIK